MASAGVLEREPQPRAQQGDRPYQICTRCIMDTSEPEIQFDADGVCNHCTRAIARIEREKIVDPQARLAALVAKIKSDGAGKEYDCVIGVSGGVDSTMVAYHVKRLGLRPLAIHLDNGWNSELAVDNIKAALERLDIDLFTHVIDWEEFRDLQLSFLKASVPNCEIPTDHAILALLMKTAMQHGTRYILTGSNLATESIMPVSWGYYNQDLYHLKAIHRRFGTRPLRTFPQISLLQLVLAVFARKIKYIPILNYLNYDKVAAKALLLSDFGWRDYGGKHYESIYTRFFQGHILPTKFGFDKRRAHLSSMICSGSINRDQALEEMKGDIYGGADLAQDREFVIKKFCLTEPEWEAIMDSPPRKHTEYPSLSLLFHESEGLRQFFRRTATRA